MKKLNSLAAMPGDVILVGDETKSSRWIVAGQTILRPWKLFRRMPFSHFPHVMLCVAPGVVIHADGEKADAEVLRSALGDLKPGLRFRAFRSSKASKGLAFFNAVAQAAQQFIGQRYSFIYGRRSGWLGRLAHRNRSETQPFCSELVATVFKSLGMPISDRPVDRVLPIDIELACTGPDWTEVTDDYYLTPLPPELGRATFSAEGREIPFSEIFDDEERFHPGFEAAVEQFRLVFRTVATAAEAMELGLQLNTARLQQAQLLYDHPHPLFENDATLARSALHILQTPPGLGTAMLLSTTVSGGLRKLFPDAQLEKPFEALPSLSEIEQREIAMDLTGVRASLLTAIATMRVLCRVTNIPGFEDVALDGVDLEAARGTIKAVPALTDAAFNELGSHLQQIRQLGGPFGDVGDLMVEAIRLQRLVTLLRDGA